MIDHEDYEPQNWPDRFDLYDADDEDFVIEDYNKYWEVTLVMLDKRISPKTGD